ncbi:hypothetical protein KGS77_00140 [Streptomyces sp. MST-110588]|nr:hypothetical protein KGS77_00140 [Streptomyces sp. MST-110588]
MAEVPRPEGENDTDARLREVFYMAFTHWLPAPLHRKDRASMAVGIQVRVPFCDHRLVEYVWNVLASFISRNSVCRRVSKAVSDRLAREC